VKTRDFIAFIPFTQEVERGTAHSTHCKDDKFIKYVWEWGHLGNLVVNGKIVLKVIFNK
jgi:hypothetical protein